MTPQEKLNLIKDFESNVNKLSINPERARVIESLVKKSVKDYGETFRLLERA